MLRVFTVHSGFVCYSGAFDKQKFLLYCSFSQSQLSLITISKMTVSQIPVTSSAYLEAVKYRRTVYDITDSVTVSDDRIIEIVNQVIQFLPSSWNMQSTRILVTLGKEHKRFWGAVTDAAKPFILGQKGEEDWQRNEERFKSFRNAYGTVCVFSTCF
jgi:hypothetical protein